MKLIDIGEVAAKTGITTSALRHYETLGLISSASRHGLRRQFPPEVLLQLKLIAMGKSAGFSLGEIAGMFGRNGMPDVPRDLFQHKAEQIDRQIVELTLLRDTLRHVADCPAPSHMECPNFRALIERAGGEGKQKRRSAPKRAKP